MSWSRFVHLSLSSTVTAYAAHLKGYEGAVIVCFSMIVVGFGWEVSNRYVPGWHPYGDALDFVSFVIGAAGTLAAYAACFSP